MKFKIPSPTQGKERRWELSSTILTGVPSSWFTEEELQKYSENINYKEKSKRRDK